MVAVHQVLQLEFIVVQVVAVVVVVVILLDAHHMHRGSVEENVMQIQMMLAIIITAENAHRNDCCPNYAPYFILEQS
jgi:hypothetical protein